MIEYKFHTAPMGQFNMHQRGQNLFFGADGVEIFFFGDFGVPTMSVVPAKFPSVPTRLGNH